VYGSPRILADLRESGERVSGKTATKRCPSTDCRDQANQVLRRFDRGVLNAV